MNDAFEVILGQPKVRDYLRASVIGEKVTHAYLFIGPAGSHKMLAATALAQALLCPKGAKGPRGGECGACDACRRIRRGKHPDVRVFQPEGASGYLLEQIRAIAADAAFAPIQAQRKVYIIDRADLLGAQAANAFLKTLEEPPEGVTFILLARSRDGVLPTIASRCQAVPFRTIPAQEAQGIVIQNAGCSPEEARFALAACDGSLTRAVSLLQSNKSLELRGKVLEALACLRRADDLDVLEYARNLVAAAKAPLDDLRAEQDSELARTQEYLSKGAVRQLEARNKRMLTARTLESLGMVCSVTRSWVRDVLGLCLGLPGEPANGDVSAQLREAASATDAARAAAALMDIEASAQALAYNVSPETCADALLFGVRDKLFG